MSNPGVIKAHLLMYWMINGIAVPFFGLLVYWGSVGVGAAFGMSCGFLLYQGIFLYERCGMEITPKAYWTTFLIGLFCLIGIKSWIGMYDFSSEESAVITYVVAATVLEWKRWNLAWAGEFEV